MIFLSRMRLFFEGWFDIGEVFRSGCVWNRGYGKVFYFQPGHETNNAFQNQYVRQIIKMRLNGLLLLYIESHWDARILILLWKN